MSAESGREVAYRVFAAEYDDATFEYAQNDEERAPKYVVTPTGARVNRLFIIGVLTSVEEVNENMVRARVADPTGVFVVYAGQYQPDALTFLERAEPPAFLAVTGKANTFEPEDGDRVFTSIRPESINAVDTETRDRWVVQTAEHTLGRVATMARGLESDARGAELTGELEAAGVDASLAEGITLAIDHYGTTPTYLANLKTVVEQALSVVTGERDEITATTVAPDEPGETVAGQLRDVAVEATPAVGDTRTETTSSTTADTEPEEPVFTPPEESQGAESTVAEPTTTDESPKTTEEPPAATEAASDTDDVSPSEETHTTDEETVGAEVETSASESVGETVSEEGMTTATQTDELYEFDEEEREQIEEEHGLEFSTGTDLDKSTTADTESAAAAETSFDTGESSPESSGGTSTLDEETATGDEESAAGDETPDLESVLLERMGALDEGEGADRSTLIDAVVEATDAEEEAVEAAIDDALMGGQCYEPADDRLKPI